MIAHIRKHDKFEQSAIEHCSNVASLTSRLTSQIGCGTIGRLAGSIHDMGKFTDEFAAYIKFNTRKVFHSPTGAIYAYDNWYGNSKNNQLAAQILSAVIRGHHGGLPDCVNSDQNSPYLECIGQDKKALYYDEAVKNFTDLSIDKLELDLLFENARDEINGLLDPSDMLFKYNAGMIARFILSCLVDSDRWDSACFENNIDPFEEVKNTDWHELNDRLNDYLLGFTRDTNINAIRGAISDRCFSAAELPRGIYTLTVPTGGGKTLSSLRFALKHIEKHNMRRLLYVIPYNTILDQNSADIKEALGGFDDILNHFGNFITDKGGDEGERETDYHKLLTERWDSPIIMTSMVQFLNSAYKSDNTDTRRFCRLVDSVIIFDEIQALPKKCTIMFERLIRFLSKYLGCTILLCTATQPGLNVQSIPLINDDFTTHIINQLNRVTIKSFIGEVKDKFTCMSAADELCKRLDEYGSALMIVNTKKAAASIFKAAIKILPEDYVCYHLSTNMCPAHRKYVIGEMKARLNNGGGVLCVSTALIEAGVNISFPCVIRSKAGLSNVIQSAGRCNRHMELGICGGNVEIWYIEDENLTGLPETKNGGDCLTEIYRKFGEINGSDDEINAYFKQEREIYVKNKTVNYPYKESSLSEMTSVNAHYARHCRKLRSDPNQLVLYQAFSEAGKNFEVIDEDTVSIIVPYKKGYGLILDLGGENDMRTQINLLREAQEYSISVYRSSFIKMVSKKCVYQIGETGAFALEKEYYNLLFGYDPESCGMEFLGY